MADDLQVSSPPPNGFAPAEFGRVLVTRMLTDTEHSWAETADIVVYQRKGDLAFHLAGLAAQLVEQLALRDGLTPLEWWQRLLAYDALKSSEEDEDRG